MLRRLVTCLLAAFGAGAVQAGPVESAIVAAMRLSEQPNYSWTATVADDARTYDVVGRTSRGGFTRVKMPVINSIRRRLGRSATDTQIEFVFRGNVACVIETDEGWKRPDELPPEAEEELEVDGLVTPIGPTAGLSRRTTKGTALGGTVIRPRGPREKDERDRGYSNLQLAISHPHEELAVIVSSHATLTVEADVVSGSLTDLGAQLLLVHDGQKEITPLRAAGTFKLWLRAGAVTKYQVELHGVLEVDTPGGRRKIEVRQKTDTVLRDIGTTLFDVPVAARQKLKA